MGTTVASFSAIDDTEVDAESPITESLVTRLRDNSYWIDPATTRTSATSNTLVLTPNQTAGTTQWQEISTLAGADGTKGTISTTTMLMTWTTLTTKTDGILDFTYSSSSSVSGLVQAYIKVDLSDDTFISRDVESGAGAGETIRSGTITTGSTVGYMYFSSSLGSFQFRRDSGNFQYRNLDSNVGRMDAIWIII